MKYLSVESAEILNIGLIDSTICNSVKKQLMNNGWIFSTHESCLNGKLATRIEIRDSAGLAFMDVTCKTNDPLKEVLIHIQDHYVHVKLFDKLKK
jgi:hypothetical protein